MAELPLASMQRDGRATLSAGHRAANLVAVAVPFGLVIASLERVGLAWNVVRISSERAGAQARGRLRTG